MDSLHFENERRHNRTNIIITIIALFTLICIGIGCSLMTKQSGSDNVTNVTRTTSSSSNQPPAL